MKKRGIPLLFLILGIGLAVWLEQKGPKDQHLRFVLGGAAPRVTRLMVEYVGPDGSPAAGADLPFAAGAAPRIVAHDPKLTDGVYRLRIDVDTREGRKLVERQVTLGGGSTSVDLVDALEAK